jgi:hypothetical protein
MTYPLAYPLAPTNALGIYLQSSASARKSGDDSMAFIDHIMKAPPRVRRALSLRRKERLSERDREIAASIGRFKYMSARQIEELHFSGHATPLTGARTCRRVLERLTRAGVLCRLERRIGGVWAGSVSYVYALTTLGYRLVLGGDGIRVRRYEPSAEFLDHTLAVAQLAVDLQRLARLGSIDLVDIQPEPGCWRRFTAGLDGVQILKPDLSVALKVSDYEYHWFVEVDLSTHSAAAVVRKCRLYDRYWATGIEQDRSGLFPRVLFVAPNARRAGLLERAIDSAHRLNAKLFAATTTADAMAYLTGAWS